MTKLPTSAVASQSDLTNLERGKLVLGGRLVFASMKQGTNPPAKNYVPQNPREATGGLLSGFMKHVPKVYVHVHPCVFDVPKIRFGLAVDAYLAWGAKQRKGQVAIVGGIERDDSDFLVDVLVFECGRLVELYDLELPPRSSVRFHAAAQSVFEGVKRKYPKAQMFQAAPLSDWEFNNVEYLGDKPLRKLSYKPLTRKSNSQRDLLIPGAIILAAALFNIGAIFTAWTKYSESVTRYERAISDPEVVKHGGIDSGYINVMTQRRLFMEAPRKQDVLPSKVLDIVRGIGKVPSVHIVEMRLPAPSVTPNSSQGLLIEPGEKSNNDLITADRVPDTWIRISVPRTNGSALDQAREVLSEMARHTGMTLRLTHRGWQEEEKRRIFTIEGFIHG